MDVQLTYKPSHSGQYGLRFFSELTGEGRSTWYPIIGSDRTALSAVFAWNNQMSADLCVDEMSDLE